jgi:hypothetical protein
LGRRPELWTPVGAEGDDDVVRRRGRPNVRNSEDKKMLEWTKGRRKRDWIVDGIIKGQGHRPMLGGDWEVQAKIQM